MRDPKTGRYAKKGIEKIKPFMFFEGMIMDIPIKVITDKINTLIDHINILEAKVEDNLTAQGEFNRSINNRVAELGVNTILEDLLKDKPKGSIWPSTADVKEETDCPRCNHDFELANPSVSCYCSCHKKKEEPKEEWEEYAHTNYFKS